jgi:methionyl-tRNA formyltransferase
MRVVFWGTPEFAAPALRALIGEGFDVAAVVTQPDKPVGRSRSTLEPPAVKQIAMEEKVRVLQPDQPRMDKDFLATLRALEPDLFVVVAYGHLLSREMIDLPVKGTVNVHASLLPLLRGAAPIQAAIRDGFVETGVSVMRMVSKLDAGPVIHQLRTPILDDETGGELTLRLSELGALALIEALALLEVNAIGERPQDDARATYASKIDRDATRVDWTRPAVEVSRQIRAYDPKPGAFAMQGELPVKLFGARGMSALSHPAPGTVMVIDGNGMAVACGDGAVQITSVRPSGKKGLTPVEWANGRGVAIGERLS